jgi:hypothetical protein
MSDDQPLSRLQAVSGGGPSKAATPDEQGNVALGCVTLVVIGAVAFFGLKACLSDSDKAKPEADGPVAQTEVRPPAVPAPPQQPARSASKGGPSDTVVIAGAMSSIKRKLVDPDSARFRNVSAYPQASGTTAVCGEVNAKNRAGGFNGYQRFISAGIDKYTWLETEMEDMDNAWATFCR